MFYFPIRRHPKSAEKLKEPATWREVHGVECGSNETAIPALLGMGTVFSPIIVVVLAP
jgi:hypothetical protein